MAETAKKAFELDADDVFAFIRIDPDFATDADRAAAASMLDAARSFVLDHCGVDREYVDAHPDMAVAVLVIVADMWDNRSMSVAQSQENRVVASILGHHSMNLL